MKFLPSLALFGFDALSFLRKKESSSKNIFQGLSLLQSFKSLVSDYTSSASSEEEDLQEVTRLLAQNIGEKELIHAATTLVPPQAAAEISKASGLISAPQKGGIANISDILEFPKFLSDFFTQ